jgi:hypothetical protein
MATAAPSVRPSRMYGGADREVNRPDGFALEAVGTPGHVPLREDPGPSGRDADLGVGQPCDVGSPPLRCSASGWLRSWVRFFP